MKHVLTSLAGIITGSWLVCQSPVLSQSTHPFAEKTKKNTAVAPVQKPAPLTLPAYLLNRPSSANVSNRRVAAPAFKPKSLRFAADSSLLKIKRSAQTGLPIFIEGNPMPPQPAGKNARISAEQASLAYLEAVKDVLQIRQPASEFNLRETQTDQLGQLHVRMKQQYQGVDVYGSEVLLHSKSGQVHALNGRYYPTPTLTNVSPSVTSQAAVQAAMQHLSGRTRVSPIQGPMRKILDYDGPESKLIIYHANRDPQAERLAWQITVRPNFLEVWQYFVDAKTGRVIHQINETCTIDGPKTATARDLNGTNQTLNTYQVGNNYYLMDGTRSMFNATQSKFPDEPVGVVWTLDAKNSSLDSLSTYHVGSANNTWTDASSVSAHFNAGKAFEYFQKIHGRNSINGQGGTVISLVNVVEEDGTGMDNAFWNGKAIFYGNGNVGFKPLAGALDVAGHEMSHGVIGNTANLEYQGQSGAINESMADVFGHFIEPSDWTLGEDVVKTSVFRSGALRDLSDPHNGGASLSDNGYQPRTMDELYTGTEDNGGVHINSGIPNFAFYKFATAVGEAKAEKVYYRALTTYLTATSQFVDLRIAVVKAATDLHGESSAEVAAANTAFDEVGIYESAATDPTTDLPTNPGQEFILVHDASTTDPNSLYVTNPNGTDLDARSTINAKRKPSVTDDGSITVFVSEDSKIRAVSLTGTLQESILQDEAIWDNASVSKDGTKIAAITTDADATIYVYDFNSQKWTEFKLYNPTYSEGVETGEVLYADAIEWDAAGEFLLYDAFNRIEKTDGVAIEYWDVGIMKVWDNATNQPGDGKISKLFTDLPENVSIGNPSFAKNSPYIAAFDYVDTGTETYNIIGANLETGDVVVIAENTTLGYPTYSNTDNQLAYTSLNTTGDTTIVTLPLKPDKISGNGTPKEIILEGKWAVWYAAGERVLLSAEKDLLTFSFPGLTPVITGAITGNAIAVTVPETTDVTGLIAQFTHSAPSTVKVGSVTQVSGATKNNFTNPVTYTVTAQDNTTKNYIVTVTKGTATGVGDANDVSRNVTLFPNPNAGRFVLKLSDLDYQPGYVEVFNSVGKQLLRQAIKPRRSGEEVAIALPNPPAGMYVVRLTIGDKTAYKRLLVQ